jgi:hypothetical protein
LIFIEDENMNEKTKIKHQSSLDAIRLTSRTKAPDSCAFSTVVRTPTTTTTTTTAEEAFLLVSSGRRLRR